jgi:non-specific serine/threonine protein kinase
LARALGDEWAVAKASHWLAVAHGLGGDKRREQTLLDEAAAVFLRLGDLRQRCNVLWNLGGAAWSAGELTRAKAALAESMRLANRLGYRWHVGLCFVALALVAVKEGACERAARLYGAAATLREAAGEPLRPGVQTDHDQGVTVARATLGPERFAAAWAAGAALPLPTAIAEALTESPAIGETHPAPTTPLTGDRLTRRELEVLRLIAAGRSDRAIADALFISRRTASKHVAAILAKLGVASRAEAAVRAVRDGLT